MKPNPTIAAAAEPQSLGVGDVYYTIFRHKWKIIICSSLGLIGAVIAYLTYKPLYYSHAKLFIRYVVTEGRTAAPGPGGDASNTKSPDMRGETIMQSEEQILTSMDLARRVAESVGAEKILAKVDGGKDVNIAALIVSRGLTVYARGSIIQIGFEHQDFEIVQPVLRELVDNYLKLHVEIHRAVGIIGDFLTQETDQLRNRLAQTEDELRKAKNRAGVISLEESKRTFAAEIARIRDEIFEAQVQLASRSAIQPEDNKPSVVPAASPAASDAPATPTTPSQSPASTVAASPVVDGSSAEGISSAVVAAPATPAIPPEKIEEYRRVFTNLVFLRNKEQELLTQFTPENSRVKSIRSQLTEATENKRKLEEEYPMFVSSPSTAPAGTNLPAGPTRDPVAEAAQISALQIKLKVLNNQLESIRAEAAKVDQAEGFILELTRKKELEEANYRYYAARLEQSRINEALGTGKVSNINQIQAPTMPTSDRSKVLKIPAAILGGGIALGLVWAFLIELLLDRSVRRPVDFERTIGIPLFLSIPSLGKKGKLRKAKKAEPTAPEATGQPSHESPGGLALANRPQTDSELARLENAHLLHSFHETLRDRLIGFFESRNVVHKPKLIAVTGLDHGSGVTTTAAGLASCLSETGEGNVLLVDMTAGQGSAQQFFQGKELCGLDDVLSTRASAQVQDNLYVVSEEPSQDRLSRILPQRFNKLVPQLKASNFDYIIFDMPAVSQLSITPRLAGFMDMVLLVVESEKTDREMVQRATALLAQSKAPVGAILNKTKTYVPARIHQETLRDI
jgi:uncharacterized protein involved in exopolysaccharide biosynthesis/Mrp family chromosome partitioning ATPase